MTFTPATEITSFADRYVQVWNEPDARTRRRLVTELWAADGIELTEEHEYRGHASIEVRVLDAHREFIQEGGFHIRLEGPPAAHHDAVTFEVGMVPAGGRDPVWMATVLAVLGADGRIERDYQFGRTLIES